MAGSERILGVRIDRTSYAAATDQIVAWARAGESRTVCAANVHVVMEAHDSPGLRADLAATDLVTPDGMPVVWYLRALGHPQERVYGPDLMLSVCGAAARAGLPIALFGTTPATLAALEDRLVQRFPALKVAWREAPPMGPWDPQEDRRVAAEVAASGARLLFVGLGCPRQERWVASQRGRLPAVMLAVGAAFDFHSGRVRQAPAFLQDHGLEWAFRLAMDPRRLAGRYLRHNPRFAALAALELARRLGAH